MCLCFTGEVPQICLRLGYKCLCVLNEREDASTLQECLCITNSATKQHMEAGDGENDAEKMELDAEQQTDDTIDTSASVNTESMNTESLLAELSACARLEVDSEETRVQAPEPAKRLGTGHGRLTRSKYKK